MGLAATVTITGRSCAFRHHVARNGSMACRPTAECWRVSCAVAATLCSATQGCQLLTTPDKPLCVHQALCCCCSITSTAFNCTCLVGQMTGHH